MTSDRRTRLVSALLALTAVATQGCDSAERRWVLPEPGEVTEWYAGTAEASFDGNVLVIEGTIDSTFLQRGGRIWARSSPYFYLFNVHVQRLLLEYPDIAAVRATTFTADGEEIARASFRRNDLSEARWREALARASLAQQEGTRNPRLVERLIQFGEDHTQFTYQAVAN